MIILGVTFWGTSKRLGLNWVNTKKTRIRCERAGKFQSPGWCFVIGSYVTHVPCFKVYVHVMWKSGNNFCELVLSFHVELSGLNASCQTCIACTFTSGAVSAASPYAFYTFFPKTVTEHQLWPRLCTGIETTERGPSLHARSSYLYYTCCGKRQLWQGTSSQGRGVGRSFPKEGNPPKFLLEELELVSYRHKRITESVSYAKTQTEKLWGH